MFVILKSLDAAEAGQTAFEVLEILPLSRTQSAPFKVMMAVEELPEIRVFAKEGLIVRVFVALASVLLLITIGKVSPVV